MWRSNKPAFTSWICREWTRARAAASSFQVTSLDDAGITLPRGCNIYLLIISDIGRNRNFDELLFYPLAKFVAEHNGYVHYAWWNNLLQPYMSGPLHPIIRNDFGLEIVHLPIIPANASLRSPHLPRQYWVSASPASMKSLRRNARSRTRWRCP